MQPVRAPTEYSRSILEELGKCGIIGGSKMQRLTLCEGSVVETDIPLVKEPQLIGYTLQ
jgi:hypothetical protein